MVSTTPHNSFFSVKKINKITFVEKLTEIHFVTTVKNNVNKRLKAFIKKCFLHLHKRFDERINI